MAHTIDNIAKEGTWIEVNEHYEYFVEGNFPSRLIMDFYVKSTPKIKAGGPRRISAVVRYVTVN